MENNWFNLMNLFKKDFYVDKDSIPDEEQKKIFNKLIAESSSKFYKIEKRINPSHFIFNYKTEERSLGDFSVYQNPIDLFKNLRDGNINTKEVLKNKTKLK